jgi:hypothetical protein
LVNFSTSHNFLKEEFGSELKIRVGSCGALVKVVNYKAKVATRVVYRVHIQLDKWKGDPGGYQWPPTFSNYLKTIFWQFW